MKSEEVSLGRTFCLTFEHGADFFSELQAFCSENNVSQGYIPMFIAGFKEVELVGTCDRPDDENAPVWSKVFLTNVEAIGAGTLTFDSESNVVSPHIHVSVGQKLHGASGHTSHLLRAEILFLVEMILVEITKPTLIRQKQDNLYNVALLNFI